MSVAGEGGRRLRWDWLSPSAYAHYGLPALPARSSGPPWASMIAWRAFILRSQGQDRRPGPANIPLARQRSRLNEPSLPTPKRGFAHGGGDVELWMSQEPEPPCFWPEPAQLPPRACQPTRAAPRESLAHLLRLDPAAFGHLEQREALLNLPNVVIEVVLRLGQKARHPRVETLIRNELIWQ